MRAAYAACWLMLTFLACQQTASVVNAGKSGRGLANRQDANHRIRFVVTGHEDSRALCQVEAHGCNGALFDEYSRFILPLDENKIVHDLPPE